MCRSTLRHPSSVPLCPQPSPSKKRQKSLNIIGYGKPRKRIRIFYPRSGLDTMSAHGPLPMRLPSLSLISSTGQADPILAITPSLSRGDLDSLHTHLTQSCMSCTVVHIHPQRTPRMSAHRCQTAQLFSVRLASCRASPLLISRSRSLA